MHPVPVLLPKPRSWQPLPGTCGCLAALEKPAFLALAGTATDLPAEGYELQIHPEGLRLRCADERAALYAWQHFQQWRQPDPARIPCGILTDAPAFPRRGFMLDVSRCKVPTREGLAEWVEKLAACRYNELQLYTEHSFAYRGHETVWAEASPLTAKDIRWLQTHCRKNGIELVPNQNCFGHFERWIKYPAYRHYAECPEGFVTPWGERRHEGSVLKPDDASFALVCGLLDQLLPIFDSPLVNIGCDETFELGQGASKERCKTEGHGRVYSQFVSRLMTYVRETHGKRCQFWGDILIKTPEELRYLPGDAMALEWGYEADHPFTADSRRFAKSGLDFVLCPGTSSWRSFAGRTENMRHNIRRATEAARDQGALGLLLTDWGDCGHLQQSPVSYPALAWCGMNAWNPATADWKDLPAFCDQAVFDGQSGDSECWLAAGRISDLLGPQPANANAIFQLFQYPAAKAGLHTIENLQTCLEAISFLPTPKAFQPEWAQTLRTLRFSLLRGLNLKGVKPADDLGRLLRELRENHRRLWLQRNREGGLAESLLMYTERVS